MMLFLLFENLSLEVGSNWLGSETLARWWVELDAGHLFKLDSNLILQRTEGVLSCVAR